MKTSTIRIVVILAALCIIGITVTQIYWVRRAFDLKEAEFERTINTALYNVAQQIFDINNTPSPATNPVKQLSTNYFIVMVNSEIDPGLLEYLLRNEFERRNILVDFEYGVYDCSSELMVYGNYVPLKTAEKKATNKVLPQWSNQAYYFGVQFPNRAGHITNQMGIWSFSSIVLLLVIVFFSYALFVILKQKKLSEIQKDFINNMTHEFKTPIATIAVSTEVLKDPEIINNPARLLNYAGIIEKENNRLKQQVERVLQMARLDKHKISLKKNLIDLHQIILEAIGNASTPWQQTGSSVSTQLDAAISELKVDRLHIANVINNLLDNAIKYCYTAPAIIFRTYNQSEGIVMEIVDNGMGIAQVNHRKVFEQFYRVPTGNLHDVKGFGLGLSYVKTVVEAHEGRISLHSELGEGCTIKIWLPLSAHGE